MIKSKRYFFGAMLFLYFARLGAVGAEVTLHHAQLPSLEFQRIDMPNGGSYSVYKLVGSGGETTEFRVFPLSESDVKDLNQLNYTRVEVENPLLKAAKEDPVIKDLCKDKWQEWCRQKSVAVAAWLLDSSRSRSGGDRFDLYYVGRTDLPDRIVELVVAKLVEAKVVRFDTHGGSRLQKARFLEAEKKKQAEDSVAICDDFSDEGPLAAVKVFCHAMVDMSKDMRSMRDQMHGMRSDVGGLAESVDAMSEDMTHLRQMTCYVEQMATLMGEMNASFSGVLSAPNAFLNSPVKASMDQFLKVANGFMESWTVVSRESERSGDPHLQAKAAALRQRAQGLFSSCGTGESSAVAAPVPGSRVRAIAQPVRYGSPASRTSR